ncbi:hypothetical protein ABZ192_41500 [Streptomyces sp. NPDC006235]
MPPFGIYRFLGSDGTGETHGTSTLVGRSAAVGDPASAQRV